MARPSNLCLLAALAGCGSGGGSGDGGPRGDAAARVDASTGELAPSTSSGKGVFRSLTGWL